MLILKAHNYYQAKNPSGEGISFESEVAMLRKFGNRVITYTRDNAEIASASWRGRIAVARDTLWSAQTYRQLRQLLAAERPAIAHFHNIFPLISPSAYRACREAGVPVIQTLHNFRLLCPGATFYRHRQVCEVCLGKAVPWPGLVHACYRASRLATAVTAAMLTAHRYLKTWDEQVDLYIAPTEFVRRKFIEGGLPPGKIVVKPNFVYPDPGPGPGQGEYALFVGRLSQDKGVETLLQAWRSLPGIPLKVVGDGPLMDRMQMAVQGEGLQQVELVGGVAFDRVISLLQQARFLVFPSQWYETFGRVAIEAFACGVPVIAAHLGAMVEVVQEGIHGLHFTPGDREDLAAKVQWAWTHPREMRAMGQACRREYEQRYTAEQNYAQIMEIYQRAISHGAAAI